MNKIFTALLMGLIFVPSAAFAQYSSDAKTNSFILSLIKEISSLKAQLAEYKGSSNKSTKEPKKDEIKRLDKNLDSLKDDRDAWIKAAKGECAVKSSKSGVVMRSTKVQKRCDALEEAYDDALRQIPLVQDRLDVLKALKKD